MIFSESIELINDFLPYSVTIVNYINWFLNIETILHSWNKTYLGCDALSFSYTVKANLIIFCLVLAFMFRRKKWPVIFFPSQTLILNRWGNWGSERGRNLPWGNSVSGDALSWVCHLVASLPSKAEGNHFFPGLCSGWKIVLGGIRGAPLELSGPNLLQCSKTEKCHLWESLKGAVPNKQAAPQRAGTVSRVAGFPSVAGLVIFREQFALKVALEAHVLYGMPRILA